MCASEGARFVCKWRDTVDIQMHQKETTSCIEFERMRDIKSQALIQAWCDCRPARVLEDAPCSTGLAARETKQCGASLDLGNSPRLDPLKASQVRAPSVLSQASPSMPSETPKRRRPRDDDPRKVLCASCIDIKSDPDSDKQRPASCPYCRQLEDDERVQKRTHTRA